MTRYAIFGGTGFIGTHLSQSLLEADPACEIVLFDLNPPRDASYAAVLHRALSSGRAKFVRSDVRLPIDTAEMGTADIVFNLAAIHREPGHLLHEYYRTNILGAEHVCAFASAVGARHLVFTSSISVYGPTEELKTEESLPTPETPYGCSKLAAEYIHKAWQCARADRRLLILRPGVVFGPGELGNVTRLVRSLVGGYFVYIGNRATRKACGYVKELCDVIRFAVDFQRGSGEALTLLNFSTTPTATMEELVDAIQDVAGMRRKPFSFPRAAMLALAFPLDAVTKLLGINQPISPTRVRKLFRSTNIHAARLQALGYQCRYSLKAGFQDWKRDAPRDFQDVVVSRRNDLLLAEKSATIPRTQYGEQL